METNITRNEQIAVLSFQGHDIEILNRVILGSGYRQATDAFFIVQHGIGEGMFWGQVSHPFSPIFSVIIVSLLLLLLRHHLIAAPLLHDA